MIGKTNNTSPEEEVLSNLKKSTDETLQKLTALSMEEKKSKNEDIKAMIHYIGGMTDTIEERRNRLIEFAWQSLTIAITAFGLIYAVKFILLLKVPVMVVLFLLFGFSVAKLIEFRAQSSFSYPFLKYKEYGNKWKWFYYGNEYILHITESPFQSKPRAKDEQSYVQGLNFLVNKYTNETINTEIVDNVIQLYLLQVHNYFKNRFYLRLLKYDKYLQSFIIIFMIGYIIFFIMALVICKAAAINFYIQII